MAKKLPGTKGKNPNKARLFVLNFNVNICKQSSYMYCSREPVSKLESGRKPEKGKICNQGEKKAGWKKADLLSFGGHAPPLLSFQVPASNPTPIVLLDSQLNEYIRKARFAGRLKKCTLLSFGCSVESIIKDVF